MIRTHIFYGMGRKVGGGFPNTIDVVVLVYFEDPNSIKPPLQLLRSKEQSG